MSSQDLPVGVVLTPLVPHRDERGFLTEVWRAEWGAGVDPVQWNLLRSEAGVLRGLNVHRTHDDFLLVAEGRLLVGLVDMRDDSRTRGMRSMFEMGDDQAVTIPHGVAHGFFAVESTLAALGVSHYYDPADELGCRFDDPESGLEWPEQSRISERDAGLGSFDSLRRELNRGD